MISEGLWSEMGDSNSRHLAPKASALPTALHPVIEFLDVVKHVVNADFWPVTGEGESAASPDVPKLSWVSKGRGSNQSHTLPNRYRKIF